MSIAFRASMATLALAVAAPAYTARAQVSFSELGQYQTLTAAGPGTPLILVTDNAQQQIEIEIGPIAGEVRVYGIDGIPSGELFQDVSAVELTTGLAQDYVEVRVYAAQAMPVTLDTTGGNSDVKVLYFAAAGEAAASAVLVRGGAGNDKVDFQVESFAASFAAEWIVEGGNGANETLASFNSPDPSDAVSISLDTAYGTGHDKVAVELTADAAIAALALHGTLGARNDSLLISAEQINAGDIVTSLDYDLGSGIDVAEVKIIGRGGATPISGAVRGGDQSDALKFNMEGQGALALTLDGGSGSDLLDGFAKGDFSGTPTLLGASGNDELKLFFDGPVSATPFVDGGAGFDIFNGFATTIINVEQIN